MPSNAERQPAATRAEVLDLLSERLERVEELSAAMRESLLRGDAVSISASTGRLDTLLLEFRLLREEYLRLPEPPVEDVELSVARERLDATALRIARSAAVGGGLLERLVGTTRRWIAALGADGCGTYESSGQRAGMPTSGLRLKELA